MEADGGLPRPEAERLAAEAHDIADPARLAALLAEHGAMTQGAAGAALGWGATRTWPAEKALRERQLVDFDRIGRAAIDAAWADFEAMNDPRDPRAWR